MKTFRNEISKEEVNELETRTYKGKVYVIEDFSLADDIFYQLSQAKILGFDTETKPSFKRGENHRVSLLQLATDDAVYLFRLINGGFPLALKKIFEDERIIKAGVAIRDDLKKLRAIHEFEPSGFCELQDLSTQKGIKSNGLRKLSAIVLGFKISKSQQLSNWEAPTLTESQIFYAATDAWVSRELYINLMNSH